MTLRLATFALLATAAFAAGVGAQVPVLSTAPTRTAVQEAEALFSDGSRSAAADLLGRHLAEQPNDGRAWFFLGRIYLDNSRLWHREGHDPSEPGPLLLEFAGTAMEQAQHLLADSGSVFRVLVSVERAVNRIEATGWTNGMAVSVPAIELPLPPVLIELGRNIMISCPGNGVLVSGSLTEVAAVWGTRLIADARTDLLLLRSDLYDTDARYRGRMAHEMGVDSNLVLPAALALAARNRPVCLGPAVDSLAAPAIAWRANRMVLVTGPSSVSDATPLVVHQFGMMGLAGSVWTASAREVYDLAARRNRALCAELLDATAHRNLPSIAACSR